MPQWVLPSPGSLRSLSLKKSSPNTAPLELRLESSLDLACIRHTYEEIHAGGVLSHTGETQAVAKSLKLITS